MQGSSVNPGRRVASAARGIRSAAPERIAALDNLRVAAIAGVIVHHAAQAYGPTGGIWPISDEHPAAILGAFFAVNAAVGMGLFFLLAGYFVPAAYARKGPWRFLRARLLRVGLPFLLFTAIILGPMVYAVSPPDHAPRTIWQALGHAYRGLDSIHFGHLWFLPHLILYSAGYALWRRLPQSRPARGSADVPRDRAILAYILALAAVTFVVRIWYPIDRWANILPLVPAEWAHLPQYVSLFAIGATAARDDWFRRMPSGRALRWLTVGLVAATIRYAYSLGADRVLPPIAGGGLSWAALTWSLWETVIAIPIALGLPIVFRDHGYRAGRMLQALAANTYLVYLIHLPIVLGLQYLLIGSALPPLLKFVLVTTGAVPLCFLVSAALRQLPYAKRVL